MISQAMPPRLFTNTMLVLLLLFQTYFTAVHLQIHRKTGRIHLWNRDEPIKYTLQYSFESKVPWFHHLFDFYQNNTCLNFQRTNGQDYHYMVKEANGFICLSNVGHVGQYRGGFIDLNYEGCIQNAGLHTALHEIQHMIGFTHLMKDERGTESFTITGVNKRPADFDKDENLRHYGFPLDIGSLMLYGRSEIHEIIAREKLKHNFGNAYTPFSDLRLINRAYGCQDLCDPEDTFRCSTNLGIPNSRDCSTCICPEGFEGPACTDRRRSMFGNPPCGDTLYAKEEPLTLTIKMRTKMLFEEWLGSYNYREKMWFPNVCVWHIRAPIGTLISVSVQGQFHDARVRRGPSEFSQWYKNSRYSLCYQAKLEIQTRNFDISGYRICHDDDISEMPMIYSDSNLVVIIAASAYRELPPMYLTYQVVE